MTYIDNKSQKEQSRQWYKMDSELYALEVEAMKSFYPHAKLGYMSTTRDMYWIIHFPKHKQQKESWTVILLYDKDYPTKQFIGLPSIKVYPVKPNYAEIEEMVKIWSIEEQKAALSKYRFKKDYAGNYYLNIGKISLTERHVLSAAGIALCVENWIELFENSMVNEKYRRLFCNNSPLMLHGDFYKKMLLENDLQ